MNPEDVEDLLAGLSDEENQEQTEDSTARDQPNDSLESQIAALFTAVNQIYKKRSPTIDQLALTVEEYVQLINILGNASEINKEAQEKLVKALGNDRTLKLCIAFSEPSKCELDSQELENLETQLSQLEELLSRKASLLKNLTETASSDSPNLAVLIDPYTIALLILKIGTLKQLALTSASNLVNPLTSPLAHDKLITEVPDNYKRQALRILSGKVILAARLDLNKPPQLNPSTSQWRRNVEHRISKLLAPPPALQERALPKPVDKKSRKRGGKRIRIQKQKRMKEIKQDFVKFGA